MTQPAPPATPLSRPDLPTAFKRILREILVVLGERTRPAGTTPVIPMALVSVIADRLHRLQRRFVGLLERAMAGTLTPVRRRTGRAPRHTEPIKATKTPRAKNPLPRSAGWLTKLCPNPGWMTQRPIGHAVVGFEALLEDETLLRLLASEPRFGRMLRPLWRMLRTEPPPACLRLPPRPRRTRAARAAPDIGRPIPKGVTRRDLQRSRAMAQPPPQAPSVAQGPQPVCGVATDWTPTHLTLGRRASVFDTFKERSRDRGGGSGWSVGRRNGW